MEKIVYREATFNVIRTHRCERSYAFDKQNNYLHTHWDILAEVNWHPALTAYTLPGGPGTAPVFTPGTFPGATDLALLSRILQPRGQLICSAGAAIILIAPQPDASNTSKSGFYPCDVIGGPSIKVVGVPRMIGIKHWVLNLHITADVRDTVFKNNTSNNNAVLSNTWVSMEDIDYQRRSVRRFAGRAILRADIMRNQNINANSLRDLYLFACPDHYKRQVVSVQLSEDGTTLDWAFDDVMQGYDVGVGSPIVALECYRGGKVTRNSPLKLMADGVRAIANSPWGANTDPLQTVFGLMFNLAAVGFDNLPKSIRTCRCDLTGDRNADLGRLTSIALGVCAQQVGFANLGQIYTGCLEIRFMQDIGDQVKTSVEMSTSFTDDRLITALNQTAGEFTGRVIRGIGNLAANDPEVLLRLLNPTQNLTSILNTMTRALTTDFRVDSRKLVMVEDPSDTPQAQVQGVVNAAPAPPRGRITTIIASRQGDVLGNSNNQLGQNDNPPLQQGAYGVVPQEDINNPPPDFNAIFDASDIAGAAAEATGTIPAGIEHLIVAALLGQGQNPSAPTTLLFDS